MKKIEHLSELSKNYDTFGIDLWGVMHNGIRLTNSAIEAVENLHKDNKKIIFLSNAPRPTKNVVKFLEKLKMNKKFLSNVVTSGQIAKNYILKSKKEKKFFHLGPSRDQSLFEELIGKKSKLEMCDYILCTGLFDEEENNLNFYKNLLKNSTHKEFICTNPDLIVHRGRIKELCAGSIAKIFEDLGGKVSYFGKPYKQVYDSFLNKDDKVLAIGDNLNTDIKGANNLNLDSIFILNGIHKSENKNLDELSKIYNVKINYYQESLIW